MLISFTMTYSYVDPIVKPLNKTFDALCVPSADSPFFKFTEKGSNGMCGNVILSLL